MSMNAILSYLLHDYNGEGVFLRMDQVSLAINSASAIAPIPVWYLSNAYC
jgi:hypothetical protein